MFSRAFCLITVLYNCWVVTAGVSPPGCQVPSKGSLRSSSPLRGSPPLTGPRPAMPFDRHLAPRLFAPQRSKANKWCKLRRNPRYLFMDYLIEFFVIIDIFVNLYT